jgi:glutamine synthetase
VALAADGALCAADKAMLFETGGKEIAARHGLSVTFLAKWNADLPGCGGHIHESPWRGGEHLFSGEGGAPSELFRRYAAGLLARSGSVRSMTSGGSPGRRSERLRSTSFTS